MARILLVKVAGGAPRGAWLPTPAISPPLGILGLASLLREHRGDEVSLLDLRLIHCPARRHLRLRQRLQEFRPHLLGLSALTDEHLGLQAASRVARLVAPELVQVVGGPHATSLPRRIFADCPVDYVVRGEGEEPFLHLLGHVLDGKDPHPSHPGICFRQEGGEVHVAESHVSDVSLDLWPLPAWDLFDFDAYALAPMRIGQVSDGRRYAALSTTRACPYRCTYCHNIFGKDFRYRSSVRVREELALLKDRYQIRTVEFLDDIFNLSRKRMVPLLEGIIEDGLGLDLVFPNGLRADLLREDEIELLQAAGTRDVNVAIESASRRIQRMVRKNLDVEKVEEAISSLVRRRIFVGGFFMLGFPTETEAEMRATIDFALRSRLHRAVFFLVTPYGATEMADGLGVDEMTVPLNDSGVMRGGASVSTVSTERLRALQKEANTRFYAEPRRLARLFRDSPARPGPVHARILWERLVSGHQLGT